MDVRCGACSDRYGKMVNIGRRKEMRFPAYLLSI